MLQADLKFDFSHFTDFIIEKLSILRLSSNLLVDIADEPAAYDSIHVAYPWAKRFASIIIDLSKQIKCRELSVYPKKNSLSFYFNHWSGDLKFLDVNEKLKFEMKALEDFSLNQFEWKISIIENSPEDKQLVIKATF